MARRKEPASGPGKGDPPARSGRPRAVGDLLPEVGGLAFRRFGFAQASLVTHWREIVGPHYARWSVPEHLKFARGRKRQGTLTIRVEGPFASQMQHLEPQIIDRANRMLGGNLVDRVRLVQGHVPRTNASEPQPETIVPTKDRPNLKGIADPQLLSALERLAAALAGGKGPPRVR